MDAEKPSSTEACWGGRIVWLYAAHQPASKAGIAWYWRIVGDIDDLHSKFRADLVSALKALVLGLYGAKDQGIPVDGVLRGTLERSLRRQTRPQRPRA